MIFVTLLICNIITNFSLTAYNLAVMVKLGSYKLRDDYVKFIDLSIRDNKYVIIAASSLVLLITFFFAIPVAILLSVHIKNFC